VVKALGTIRTREKRSEGKSLKAHGEVAVRASISFPLDLYETLEEIAQQKRASLEWVVWDAVKRYVAERSAEASRPGKG
jgi:hypothetical protein